MKWRWDQGRLDYFKFDAIKRIATCLWELDGTPIEAKGVDLLRDPLMAATGLPFAPEDYKVWRNYGRVFGVELLATRAGNLLVCTELCRELANESSDLSADDYFAHVARRAYFPSPVFEGYDTHSEQVFPFCAILKLLASAALRGNPSVSSEEVFSYLVGNEVTGTELLVEYAKLPSTARKPVGDEGRQVRELMIFLSQLSFLKWDNRRLFLDLEFLSEKEAQQLVQGFSPVKRTRDANRTKELLALGSLSDAKAVVVVSDKRLYDQDEEFIEGKKVRVTHLRSERSSKLRKMFFAGRPIPYLCDICELDPKHMYPWTRNLLEIHHMLPLSSPVDVAVKKTSTKDLVPLCPNCHRATHSFYRKWLDTNKQRDFKSAAEAKNVYSQVKQAVN